MRSLRRALLLLLLTVLPALGLADTITRACPSMGSPVAASQGAPCCDHDGKHGPVCKLGLDCKTCQAFHADASLPGEVYASATRFLPAATPAPRSTDPDARWRPPRSA